MEDSEAGVLVLDSSGVVERANPAARRMLGHTLGRAPRRAASEWVRSVIAGEDLVGEVLRRPGAEIETVLAAPEGGELPVLWRSGRLKDGRTFIILRDLTHLRRVREELRRNERLATLGQLAAGAAHEIRNPLAGIGTSAQVLLRRFEPRDERARFVRVILEEVERLDRIVSSLLQYARPRTPQLAVVVLEPLIRKVIELAGEALRETNVRIEVQVAPRLAPVHLDSDLITQVLLNLTLNAVQSMPNGGTLRYEVRLSRRRCPPRGPGRRAGDPPRARERRGPEWQRFLQVRVSDTGSGIPRGLLPKLFDPFFTTKPRGTGLGLAISQTIMHEHGGTIEIASREARGTTVLLGFPLEKRHGERRQPDPHRSD
ncbi:MAG: ATP-binding protein [Candidatus Eisenbacteria bacterium]